MMKKHRAFYHSTIGTLEICGTERGIESVGFIEGKPEEPSSIPSCLRECVNQLDEYFQGKRQEFSVAVVPEGTAFEEKVWRQLLKVPFGATASYKDIAGAVGNPGAFRAVGNANRKNPVAVIIPCHRVIGSNGKLIGYGGGLWRKEWLLNHEGRTLSSPPAGKTSFPNP